MKIRDVGSLVVSIPLRTPVAFSTRVVPAREFTIAIVATDEGLTGFGYAMGGRPVDIMVREIFRPILIGEDALAIEGLWEKMFRASLPMGRKGAAIRALSIVDIALWDIKGQALGLPLYKLLGGFRDQVPAYASGGYYREGKGLGELAEEMARYVAQGFRAVKMKVGRLSPKEDLKRVEAVRRAIGDDIDLMVDANNAWNDPHVALTMARALEEYRVRWIEEPVMPDNYRGAAELAAAVDTPIAAGELEYTRWGFRDLITNKAADILQPDVAVVGGVSEWLKVAAMASAFDLPLAPHYIFDVQAHLVAATPHALCVEYFVREEDIMNFDDVLQVPLKPKNGFLPVPQEPGLGIKLNDAAVARYRVE